MKTQSLHKVHELLATFEQGVEKSHNLPTTLQHIAKTAQKLFVADNSVIFSMNPISGKVSGSFFAVEELLPESMAGLLPQGSEGLMYQVFNQGIVMVGDVEKKREYQSLFARQEKIRSFAVLPLQIRHHQKRLGVLYLCFKRSRRFNADDSHLFQHFADQASFLLQEAWLLHRFQSVASIGQEINHELSTASDLFQKLQSRISTILDTSHAFLLAVYQPQTNTLNLYAEEEGQILVKENDPIEGASGYVITTQETLFIRKMSQEAGRLPFQRVQIPIGDGVAQESLIFVPLLFREVVLGVLSVQHPEPSAYNQEDLFILQLLANHIALALHNLRLYDNLTSLNEAGQLLTQQLNSEQVLQATVEKIREAAKADIVLLYPYDTSTQRFIVPPRVGGEVLASPLEEMSPTRPDDLASLTLRQAKPIFAKESIDLYKTLHADHRISEKDFRERENISSAAALPLQVGDVSVGALFVNFRQPQRFDASQRLFIEGLAHYASIAIKNAQEFESLLQRRLRELEILQIIDRELNSKLDDPKTVLETLLKKAHERVPADEAAILLFNPSTNALESAAVRIRTKPGKVRQGQFGPLSNLKGILRWVMDNKRPARAVNVYRDHPWKDLYFQSSEDTISELDVPLLDGTEVIGIFNFESAEEGFFHQEEEDFLRTLAGQAVLVIKNAQAFEREKRLAEEHRVLNKISKEIIEELDTAHIFDVILQQAMRLTDCSTGQLLL
jgi:GAF domain-containing protein